MPDLPAPSDDARRLLALRRSDRPAALAAMKELSVERQLALVCEAPVARRAELLDLAPQPELLIPALPPAELVFTVKAIGLESASWVLEHATPEQVVAAVDLDGWRGSQPEPEQRDAWLDAIAEVEDEALACDLEALDDELIVSWLQQRIAVVQKPDDDTGWQPPDGFQTLEGQFYFGALDPDDDVAGILRVLHLLFNRDYWTYFRLMQGVMHELPTENEEFALRWRNARLQDLGFPPWDEAMSLYRYLAPGERARMEPEATPLDIGEWHLPVWVPSLPAGPETRHRVFQAVAELEPEERRAAFYAFVAVANKVAAADRMDLSDVETSPRAIEKAAVWTSRGLEHVAEVNGVSLVETLRRVPLERLFRIGANLDPEAAGPPPPAGD